jgi:hypothetical protein
MEVAERGLRGADQPRSQDATSELYESSTIAKVVSLTWTEEEGDF